MFQVIVAVGSGSHPDGFIADPSNTARRLRFSSMSELVYMVSTCYCIV